MASRRDGNAAKRVVTDVPPPWRKWKTKARHARAIRFMEQYCILPKGFGARKPIQLAEFQKNWLEEVLAPGVRSALMAVARANGKSTFLGAFSVWALMDEDDSGAPQVPVVATTLNQAVRATYAPALAMIAAHHELDDRALVYSAIGGQKVRTPHNFGEMFPVSNDPDGLQGLDPSVAVCDEIGFMPVESWGSLLLASGKRPQSLVVGIGTPGFDKHSALWHLRERKHSGDDLPGFYFKEYAADPDCDIHDEDQWRKANPALAEGYKDIESIRMEAAITPEGEFRIFQLGQWIEGVECWLGGDARVVWRNLTDPWEMEPGADTWVGIDVGLKHDSTAVVWCQRRPDGRMHFKARIWFPAPDGRLDVSEAMQFLRELATLYRLKGVAYDNRFFDLPGQQLADEGFPMLEFPQSLERMTPAVGSAYEAIKRGEVSHDGDEAFETQVLNAMARYSDRGFTLAKAKSRDRIDACVAMVMGLAIANLTEEPSIEPQVAFV